MMKPICKLTHQAGLSLLELSISLAIASAVAVLLLRQQSEELRQVRLKTESQWVVGVLADIQQNKGSSANFASLSDYTLGTIRSVPAAYLKVDVTGTTVTNGFGGNVHVAPLSLGGGTSNAYALSYSSVPRDTCAKLVVSLHEFAKSDAPLYGIIGDTGVTSAVPTTIGMNADGTLFVSGSGQKVLKASSNAGLDMSAVGEFCDSANGSSNLLRSLTLIRWP